MLETAGGEGEAARRMRAFEIPAHRSEFLRRGILKRIDRLLLVADGKDCPEHVARAGTGGEFGDQSSDNLPLLAAGILGLVYQEVIDAHIEFVMNPGGIDAGEQSERLVD